MSTTPIVFLDTETDGVHPGRKAWEIAMIRREIDGSQEETHFYVDIGLSTADPFGLKIGRFYERHPAGRFYAGLSEEMPDGDLYDPWSTQEAAREVARWTHGAHLVGAVPNFDTEVLAELLRDNLLTPAWHYHLIDVEAMAVGYLAGVWKQASEEGHLATPGPWSLPLPWKSDDLCRACGVEPASDDERHTALGDARWAMRWYDRMTGQDGVK